MYGIKKGDKHSYDDFKLRIVSREVNPPSKRKIKETVPFMNGSYDFSSIYGGTVYEDRTLKYVLDLRFKSELEYFQKKTAIINWLLSRGKEPLFDDFMTGVHFLAECEAGPEFSDYGVGTEISVEFVAYPFMIGNTLEGEYLLWDDINFELPDYIQTTEFQVEGSKTVTIYLSGSNTEVPTVVVDSNMACTLNGYTANFTQSKNTDYEFELKPGENIIEIVGTGNIDFQFKKEVL